MPVIEVVAGIIQDASGRILLARRTEDRDFAGLWEFPGGKREVWESSESALMRELNEELGIEVEIGDPLITVAYAYPHKRLQLDVRWISDYRGNPKGCEGQALAWAPPAALAAYAMPAADRPVVATLLQPDRYLVTPSPGASDDDWLDQLEHAFEAGVCRAQLRLGDVEPARRRRLVAKAVLCAEAVGVELLINDDLALALEFGIGLHLPAASVCKYPTRPVSSQVSLAASCHDQDELLAAEQLGCDFAVLGPVAATPTHGEVAGIGWQRFAQLRELVSLPLYAIGGMTVTDIPQARRHGAQGIAAIRSLWLDANK